MAHMQDILAFALNKAQAARLECHGYSAVKIEEIIAALDVTGPG
jgi:hypothetical protein